MKHLVAQDSVARGPLLLELGEDTCLIGVDATPESCVP